MKVFYYAFDVLYYHYGIFLNNIILYMNMNNYDIWYMVCKIKILFLS